MRAGSLFTGVGGLDLAVEAHGFEVVWQAENDPWCSAVLARHWPGVPNHGDVKEIDYAQVEPVELVCAGFPCQPVSHAGRRAAQADPRWLWPEIVRCLSWLRPTYVFLENVRGLLSPRSVEEPNDRCLCGWPYRRRGVHLHHPGEQGACLRAPGGCRHDGEGERPAGQPASVLRRHGASDAVSVGPVGRGTLLERVGVGGAGVPRAGAALPATQGGAGAIGDPGRGDPPGSGPAVWPGVMVGRDGRPCGAAPAPDTGAEPEGADGDDLGRGGICPACGRDVAHAAARSVLRSGLSDVLGDLAALGFDAQWDCVRASDVGAPHQRERVFVLAYAQGLGAAQQPQGADAAALLRGGPGAGGGAVGGDRAEGGLVDRRAEPRGAGALADAQGEQRRQGGAAEGEQLGRPASGGADLAHADGEGQRQPGGCLGQEQRRSRDSGPVGNTEILGRRRPWEREGEPGSQAQPRRPGALGAEPGLGGGPDGLPRRLDLAAHRWPAPPGPPSAWEPPRTVGGCTVPHRGARLKALGNAVVPQAAALAFGLLWEQMEAAR